MSNQERGKEALDNLSRALKSRERAEKRKPLAVVAIAAVAILVIVGGIWFVATRGQGQNDQASQAEEASAEASQALEPTPLALERETPLGDEVSCTYDKTDDAARRVSMPEEDNISAKGTVKVNLDTNKGPIGLELDRETSPCTTNAIEHLAEAGYYDDTVCHRLTTEGIYVLQCGDPSGTGAGGPGFSFANEYPTDESDEGSGPVIYPRGSIAMANSGLDTNGSQFFLSYKDSELPPQYTYFGKVSDEGLQTLDKIAEAGVKSDGAGETPAEEVKIASAKVGK